MSYRRFPSVILSIKYMEEILNSFEFKDFILKNIDLIQSPEGKKLVMGEDFEVDNGKIKSVIERRRRRE